METPQVKVDVKVDVKRDRGRSEDEPAFMIGTLSRVIGDAANAAHLRKKRRESSERPNHPCTVAPDLSFELGQA